MRQCVSQRQLSDLVQLLLLRDADFRELRWQSQQLDKPMNRISSLGLMPPKHFIEYLEDRLLCRLGLIERESERRGE